MAGIFAFTCKTCGERHEGSPSFAFEAPAHYYDLTAEQKAAARLTSDICVIRHEEGTDRFIRVVLEIPIHGVDEPFTWGVWISLSKENFRRYIETWDTPDETDRYFGWLCNELPYYPSTLNLKTTAQPKRHGKRPSIALELTDHPLTQHQSTGITIEQAQAIGECALHRRRWSESQSS